MKLQGSRIMMFILIGMLFLRVSSVCAETILLKSGKSVEGKLLEKTDKYIKLDLYGVPVTYFFDEIDSINGEKVGSVLPRKESISQKAGENVAQPVDSSQEGEWHSQKEGLFKIFIPKGWQCIEGSDRLKITDLERKDEIFIGFKHQEFNEDVIKLAVTMPIKLSGGRIIKEGKTNFKGIEALRWDYSMPKLGETKPLTDIFFAEKGYMFEIGLGGVDKEERLTQEKIIESLQF